MGLLKRILGKSPLIGGGSGGKSHEHYAGEFSGSGHVTNRHTRAIATKKLAPIDKSAGHMTRAAQSLRRARESHEKARTAKTHEERAEHSIEAKKHADNVRRQLQQVNSTQHAADAEQTRQSAERIHRHASDMEKSSKTEITKKPPPKLEPTKHREPQRPIGPVGPFAISASRQSSTAHGDVLKARESASHHETAKSHLDKATKHLSSRDAADISPSEKIRHAVSALSAARRAIASARAGGGPAGHRMIEHAAAVAQDARETIKTSSTTASREIADKARHHARKAAEAEESARGATGTEQKLHQLIAAAHRRRAIQAAHKATNHFEKTGEGLDNFEEMHGMLSRKRKIKGRLKS